MTITSAHPPARLLRPTLHLAAALAVVAAGPLWARHLGVDFLPDTATPGTWLPLVLSMVGGVLASWALADLAPALRLAQVGRRLDALLGMSEAAAVGGGLAALQFRHRHTPDIAALIDQRRPQIEQHLRRLQAADHARTEAGILANRQAALRNSFAVARADLGRQMEQARQTAPALRADRLLADALQTLTTRHQKIAADWEARHDRLSWWGKLTTDPPNCKALVAQIRQVTEAQNRLHAAGEPQATLRRLADMAARGTARLGHAEAQALRAVPTDSRKACNTDGLARSALILSAISVPVSAWADITRAADVYDALRAVNGNFAGLSDGEIWLHTLTMPGDSLAGLVSLAKGSYFETLVEARTGGVRFAEFNHPDTDIVIDGIAHQIKATDSASYVDSVPDHIPVIATTEVAAATGAIDGGYADADLSDAVDLALGGTVIDMGDTAVDAVLTGVGGLGLLATLRGIAHARRSYAEHGEAETAALEGLGVAVTGTAKAFVDTAELGYKVISSRPSRFAGRVLLGAGMVLLNRIDPPMPDRKDTDRKDKR